MAADKEPQEVIEGEVKAILSTEQALKEDLAKLEQELVVDPRFKAFIEKQTELNQAMAQAGEVWKKIEEQMITNKIKSIKGEWGSLTIGERLNFKIDLDLLPAKFIKKVADTTKIATVYKLEDKAPKGTEPYITRYLIKRFK